MQKQKLYKILLGLLVLTFGICFSYYLTHNEKGVEAFLTEESVSNYQLAFNIYGAENKSPKDMLKGPMGVVVDNDYRIFVSDSGNGRIQVFDSAGKLLYKFGSEGVGKGQLRYPTGLAILENKLYVADSGNSRIVVFSLKGKFEDIIEYRDSDTGNAMKPTGLGVLKDYLIVTDTANHQIIFMEGNGDIVKKVGRIGNGQGQFAFPNGVAVDKKNHIYITDSNNNRVQIFDEDGKFLSVFGDENSMVLPRGIGVDKWGNIYVVNTLMNQVKVLNSEYQVIATLGTGRVETNDQGFYYPNGLYVGEGFIIVTDRENNRLMVFKGQSK